MRGSAGGRNKGKRYPPEVLKPDEVRALIHEAGRGSGAIAVRNRALVAVLYSGALRASEALALRPQDIDAEHGIVRVRGKGDKARTVRISDAALAHVERWLDRRRALGISKRAPLFCAASGARKGSPLATSYLRRLLPALKTRAGIDRERINPHALRHTRAFELAESSPVHVIQAVLGHTSLSTTNTYLRHVRPQEVIDAMASDSLEHVGEQ